MVNVVCGSGCEMLAYHPAALLRVGDLMSGVSIHGILEWVVALTVMLAMFGGD